MSRAFHTSRAAAALALLVACGGGAVATAAREATDPEPGAIAPTDAPPPTDALLDASAERSTEAGSDAEMVPQDAGPPAIRFVGRFDTRDPQGPTCAWPGCKIVANFTGPRVAVRLDERLEPWMQGGPSEWDVTIDGGARQRLVLELGAHEYLLGEGLGPGSHRVELYRRTEAQNGYTQFLGFDFGGGALEPPPLPLARRIEIVGDSAAAGFGVEGVGLGPDCPGPDWAATFQNFRKSFGARLGEMLNADVHGTVYSGKGLVRNIWRPDPDTMPKIYGRANPLFAASVYDTSTFIPDVFVVMMGGNDFAIGQPVDDGVTPLPQFVQAVRDLVSTFRSSAPQAYVFLALSPSVTDEMPPGRGSRTSVKTAFDAVASERASSGDARVYSVAPDRASPSELTGCESHGSPEFHDRLATQLAASIKARNGW